MAGQSWLEANFLNQSSDWWELGHLMAGRTSLENSYLLRCLLCSIHALDGFREDCVANVAQGRAGMQAYSSMSSLAPCTILRCSTHLISPRQREYRHRRHTGCYLGQQLYHCFQTANGRYQTRDSISDRCSVGRIHMEVACAKALHGSFDELGSSGYWTRTWPCVWDLHTLSAPDSR